MPLFANPSLPRQLSAITAAAVAVATPFLVDVEGFEPVARHDPIDPPGIITVCNGITNYDIPTLKVGDRYSKKRCDQLLAEALPKRYAPKIDKCVTAPISINTRAALYSGSYNLGPDTICKSSMVRKLNRGDLYGGCEAFMLYTYANGKQLRGLYNRRVKERALCLKP